MSKAAPITTWRGGGGCQAGSVVQEASNDVLNEAVYKHAGYLNRTRTPDTAPGTQAPPEPLLQVPPSFKATPSLPMQMQNVKRIVQERKTGRKRSEK